MQEIWSSPGESPSTGRVPPSTSHGRRYQTWQVLRFAVVIYWLTRWMIFTNHNPARFWREVIRAYSFPIVMFLLQRQMRHSDSRITLQKYAHVIGDAQRRAVDSLAGRVLELTR